MATTIQIKRSTGTTAPGTLANGELAYTHGTGTQANLGDRLFIGDGSSVNVVGGQYFTDQLDHVQGSLTASSAMLVDGNKAISEIFIGNSTNTGGQLKLLEGTSNGTNFMGIKAPNAVTANVTLTLPDGDGNNGEVLKTDGSGNLSWASAGGDLTIAADSGSSDDVTSTDTLTFEGGEGIDTTVSDNKITIAGEDATTSNKGIASFDSNDFVIASGAVSLSTTPSAFDQVNVDNLRLDANTLSTTNSNGNITLDPNGTGAVNVPSGYEARAGFGNNSLTNKSYVDSVANGLDVKKSCRVATTATLAATYNNGNGTLTANANGAISIDSVTLSANDRVLVKDMSNAVQNGFYKVTQTGDGSSPYILTRTPDSDEASELTGGAFTFVEEGTANADNGYVITTNGTPTLGSTNIDIEQFSGAGQITAGNGLTKTGNTIDVVGTADNITAAANAISIATTYVGQTSITTLGTISTGTWNGTAIGAQHGGTGLTTAPKGSVLIANSLNTISALDGGGSNDSILSYDAGTDTISWATSVDGGTF